MTWEQRPAVGSIATPKLMVAVSMIHAESEPDDMFAIQSYIVHRTISVSLSELVEPNEYLQRADFYIPGGLIASVPFAFGVGYWQYVAPPSDENE